MTKLKLNRLFWAVGVCLSLCLNASEEIKQPSFRLIVTGGIQGVHDGYDAFYQSSLFRMGDIVDEKLGDFIIDNAKYEAFIVDKILFISLDSFSKNDILNAGASKSTSKVSALQGLLGAQTYGFTLNEKNQPVSFKNDFLRRELGGIYNDFSYEKRQVKNKMIYALNFDCNSKTIKWPSSTDSLIPINVVLGKYKKTNNIFLFVPRKVASTPRVFGLVDNLLQSKKNIPTRYLDLGNALVTPADESEFMAKQMSNLLLARNPVVLGASRYDFSVLFKDKSILDKSPYVLALSGLNNVKHSIFSTIGNQKIQFTAIGGVSADVLPFLPVGISTLSIEDVLQSIKTQKEKGDIVFGLSDNPNSANAAIMSPFFNAVFSLVSGKKGALPASDDINLEQNFQAGLGSVAPLVRVSSADVTEVLFWVDNKGNISRVNINRYPVLGEGIKASDAKKMLEKDSKNLNSHEISPKIVKGKISPLTQTDLDNMLGNILLTKDLNSELVILEKVEKVTELYSELPQRLAQSLLERPGRAVSINLQGKYLKRIFKAANKNQFGLPIIVVGGNLKNATIGLRRIDDAETYYLIVTENVLLAINAFMKREGLFNADLISSASLLNALQDGSKEALKILSASRKSGGVKDFVEFGENNVLLQSSPPIPEIVHEALSQRNSATISNYANLARIRHRPALVFSITELDLGIKYSHTNDELKSWQNDIFNSKADSFTEPRFFAADYLNILFNLSTSLKYFGAWFDADLVLKEKFFQPKSENASDLKSLNQNTDDENEIKRIKKFLSSNRPEKDSTKISASMNVPFNRIMSNPILPDLDLGILSVLTYETQIWPNVLMTSIDSKYWPNRVNDMRLFLGINSRPKSVVKSFYGGGVLGYDFNRARPVDAVAWGLELGAEGKWNIGSLSLGLDSSIRQMFPFTDITPDTQDRMGLFFLTDARAEMPIYGGFSMSALVSFTVGARMNEPLIFGCNTILGLALSYGGNFKWLL